MNIHTPSTPRHLRITQTMVEDFLCDPVLGIWVIFGIKLDAFQQSRARTYWWIPNVIDSSGVGTGKSLGIWLTVQLRCLLMPGQKVLVLYQQFDTGKRVFWNYYREQKVRSKIFEAQLGKVDLQGEDEGKANSQGASCYIQFFKNDSEVQMPAPNWLREATGQKGIDINMAVIDEWTESEKMGRKDGGQGGINKQILSRVRRSSFNQHHPLWGNHRLFTASAESPQHPAWTRYRAFVKQVERGNPNYGVISYSYKDFSNRICHTGKSFADEYRNDETYASMRTQLTTAEFKRQGLGLWERETQGWYSEEAIQRCITQGKAMGLLPMVGRTDPILTEIE